MIDVHAHFLTPEYRELIGLPDGMPYLPEWSAPTALRMMDEVGIDAAALSVSAPGVHFGDDAAARELARAVNEACAKAVAEYPTRFGMMASLPLPDVDGALAELAHAYDVLGADGVVLMTNAVGVYPSDPRVSPVLAELNARGAVVLLHPTTPCGWEQVSFGRPRPMVEFPFESTRTVVDLIFSGSLTRFPDIRWIIPHTGGVLPMLADRVQVLGDTLGVDGLPVDVVGALRRMHYDLAGAALPRALPALLSLVDSDQVLYGSDYPFTSADAVKQLASAIRQAGVEYGAHDTDLFPRLTRESRSADA